MRQTKTHKDKIDKETKRQRDKETKRQRDKETKRQRDKETKRQRERSKITCRGMSLNHRPCFLTTKPFLRKVEKKV
jgi:hypothetical protein